MSLKAHGAYWGNSSQSSVVRPAVTSGGLCLRFVQFAGKSHQAQQGNLITSYAANSGHGPDQCPKLATVTGILPAFASPVNPLPSEKGGVRENHHGVLTGALTANH